jgi:hypothetical protein
MPCISSVQLRWWSNVQKKISQRRLQGVESKVQEIERHDGESNGSVGDLDVVSHGFRGGNVK